MTVLLFWIIVAALLCWAVRKNRRDLLAARADQQHAWRLAGDPRGIYGDYPNVADPWLCPPVRRR